MLKHAKNDLKFRATNLYFCINDHKLIALSL